MSKNQQNGLLLTLQFSINSPLPPNMSNYILSTRGLKTVAFIAGKSENPVDQKLFIRFFTDISIEIHRFVCIKQAYRRSDL